MKIYRNRKFLFMMFLLVFVSFGFSPYLEAKIYKWVDEEGVIHFSDKAPDDGAAEEVTETPVVKIKITGPDTSHEQTTENLDRAEQPRRGMGRSPKANPGPRFRSPEKTWETFKNALLEGDADGAMECFVPRRQDMREIYLGLGRKNMREEGQKLGTLRRVSGDRETAKYRTRRKENGRYILYYIHFSNINGEWKIEQL